MILSVTLGIHCCRFESKTTVGKQAEWRKNLVATR